MASTQFVDIRVEFNNSTTSAAVLTAVKAIANVSNATIQSVTQS
jgi:hypothetical protein